MLLLSGCFLFWRPRSLSKCCILRLLSRAAKGVEQTRCNCYRREWHRLLSKRGKPVAVDGGQGRQQTRVTIYCRGWHGLFDVFRWKAWAFRWNMVAYDKLSLRLCGVN